jgi:Fe-S cluster assembly protein SufD
LNSGALWARTSLRADTDGIEAEATVSGITFARGKQHNDQRILVNHFCADTRSSQLFKGVLKDQSRGVVNGKIYIAQDAQEVVSSQLNHALLLSPGAEADIKPELEIYADDVKANHGASIGRLDQDKVFYLVSRGIRRHQAQQMLAHAFVTDVLMKIESRELRALADERVNGWLPAFIEEMEA